MRTITRFTFRKSLLFIGALAGILFINACSSPETKKEESAPHPEEVAAANEAASQPEAEATPVSDKGVGPITSLDIPADIDQALADKGKTVFEANCSACHKVGERYVGPAIKGVTERRKPEWIMNMILNPQEMVNKDPQAQELLAEFMTQMPNQNLTQEDARAVLEYFRTLDKK